MSVSVDRETEDVAPNDVAIWLQDLYDQRGYLTAELVRDEARNPECPAHRSIFNVDTTEAAEAYYLNRARILIRSVKVRYRETNSNEPTVLRAYHAIPVEGETPYHYVRASDLAKRPDQLQLATNEAIRRLREAERALENLHSLSDSEFVRSVIEPALRSLQSARNTIRGNTVG